MDYFRIQKNMNEIFDLKKSEKETVEINLRPSKLEDYYGQEKTKRNLKVFIESAKIRGVPLHHVLFYGPPGLGKTTLAMIIANEMGANLVTTSGPAIDKPADLAAILTSLNENDVLFIDEIHRLNKAVEEILYPAMEDFVLDILVGQEDSSRSIRLNLPKFTLVGATTKAGALSAPLRDRFGSVHRLELYNPETLAKIIKRDAELLNIKVTETGLQEIAKRSRGTPRIAIRILQRLRDFAIVENKSVIDGKLARYGLAALDIDDLGLDSTDLRILHAISDNFNNGPVGLETLSSFIGEDAGTIEDVSEPYLMQSGLIAKTPRGRILTEKGKEYLKK